MNLEQALDRIELLEQALGIDDVLQRKLVERMGAQPREALVIGMLYKREFVGKEQLYTVMFSTHDRWPHMDTLSVFIMKARRTLKPYGVTINTAWSLGWSMQGKEKLRELLGE